jgi:predicted RND superfamily exporter protein
MLQSSMKNLEALLGQWVIKHRWLLITACLIFAAAAGSGIRYLTFTNDLRVFFSEANPQLQALEALENTYNKIDNVFFIIAPTDANAFTRKTLSAVEELTEDAWQIPYSSRVDSITNFQHSRAEDDELIVEDLITDAQNMDEAAIQGAREIALAEPRIVNEWISPSGHVTGININVLLPDNTPGAIPEVVAYARMLAHDFRQKHPEIDIYIAGAAMFDNAFSQATRDDMQTLVPVMFLVLVAIVGLALRSLTGAFATLIIIGLSTVTGMGFAGWLSIP